jgi:uncharacterized protein (DUF1810 family)
MCDELLKAALAAQEGREAGYKTALREINTGRKTSHWIWYVWPVLHGVRTTSKPQFELPSIECACAWLRHATLGPRLVEITSAAVSHLEAGVPPKQLFGSAVDAFKFHNCVTLFQVAATQAQPQNVEAQLLFNRALLALGQEAAEPTLECLTRNATEARGK